jgi:hypothetical protein
MRVTQLLVALKEQINVTFFPLSELRQLFCALGTYDTGRTLNTVYSHFVAKVNPRVWQFKF